MKSHWLTLVPMLAAAALVLWGGERLSRRTVEERIPADRDRVFDLAAALRGELDRLDDRYAGHLEGIAVGSVRMPPAAIAARCENLVGLRKCGVFLSWNKVMEVAGKPPPVGMAGRVPEVVAEGAGSRFTSRNTVELPTEVLTGREPGRGWLPGPDADHSVRWFRTDAERVVAFVIDERELEKSLRKHLASWLEVPLTPLREKGERVALLGPGGEEWLSLSGAESAGPAALVLPHRTGLGEWQLLAWDKLRTEAVRDTATLVVAGTLACALLLAGALLQIQQGRALRLAEERVSFVNRVSHELGTPLTNILLNLDLAARGIEARPAEARRRLSMVHEEVRRLGRLVANVLTFSRSERKTLELSPATCVPDEVVEDVLAQFQPSLDRRKVVVEWRRGASGSTRLDPDALAQIAGNLISNVEKYASAGGWLGLDTALEDGRLVLRVSDRGPGIPAKFHGKIFGAFERVHRGLNEGASGTGLGLSIARDLARRMGGDLVLRSSEMGAVFELGLPAPSHLTLLPSEVA